MGHARLGVELGAAAGAGGGAIAAASLYALKRRRLRQLIREVTLLERQLEDQRRELHGDCPLPRDDG